MDREPTAWVLTFGPVGSRANGYLVRAEMTARSLEQLGFAVVVLENSKRRSSDRIGPRIEVRPTWPSMVPKDGLLGSFKVISELRSQIAMIVGLLTNWREVGRADVLVIEGGLFFLEAALIRLRGGSRPTVIFDTTGLMSALHRHGSTHPRCPLTCTVRRLTWRVIERVCAAASDVVVICGIHDAPGFLGRTVRLIPLSLPVSECLDPIDTEGPLTRAEGLSEDRQLIGFVGNGRLAPNRRALSLVLDALVSTPGLDGVRCRVIGDPAGYPTHARLEFVGFQDDLFNALGPISVCCAPMHDSGGVSTKVLAALLAGKRTVCSAEAARGIPSPPRGLWVADDSELGETLLLALSTPWSVEIASEMRKTAAAAHSAPATIACWREAIFDNDSRGGSKTAKDLRRA